MVPRALFFRAMVPPVNMVQTALPVQLVIAVINIECGNTLKICKRETQDLLGMS